MYITERTYTDYKGVEKKETFMFNLSEAELMDMEIDNNGFEDYINKIINAQNYKELKDLFKEILLLSYGVRSDDGRHFYKSEKLREEFKAHPVYSDLFILFVTDTDEAIKFVNGIIPNKGSQPIAPVAK